MAPKRKHEGTYSSNPHTVKARRRVEAMSHEQKVVHHAKDRLRQAISRGLKALQATPEYTCASPVKKEKLITSKRNEIEWY